MWAFSPILVAMVLVQLGPVTLAEVQDIWVTIYSKEGRKGRREPVLIGNCLPIHDEDRSKVPDIVSLQPRGAFLRAYQFDCCQGKSIPIFPGQKASLNLTLVESPGSNTSFSPRSLGRFNMSELVAPPTDIEDPFLTRDQKDMDDPNLLTFSDINAAVYFSDDQLETEKANWIYNFLSLGWGHVKKIFGPLGKEDKIYAIFHGHDEYRPNISRGNFLQTASACQNLISIRPPSNSNPGSQQSVYVEKNNELLDRMARFMSEIVEQSFNGTRNSASANLTRNSAFADIFTYDLYTNLSMTADADRVKATAEKRESDVPRPGTKWWSNWFYPIYTQYGGSKWLHRFLRLQATNFPKTQDEQGLKYAREMNLGEYVHFCSGASRTFLGGQAYKAFGFNQDFKKEAQFLKALTDFPDVTKLYALPNPEVTTPKAPVVVTPRKVPIAVTTPKVPLF